MASQRCRSALGWVARTLLLARMAAGEDRATLPPQTLPSPSIFNHQSVVNFVHSSATLLSGGLGDCPTPLDENCVGGVASVSAYLRHHAESTDGHEPTFFIPKCDRTSPFVQMHPMTWTVNRLILHEHFDWPVFRASLSLLMSPRELSYLRTSGMPLLITNALIPPSNSWFDHTKRVYFDAPSRLAVMYVLSDSQPNSWPGVDSAINALDQVAEVNAGVTGKDRWIPLVVYDDYLGFEEFLDAVAAHEHPPQVVLAANGPDVVWKYSHDDGREGPWVGKCDDKKSRSYRFRIFLDENNAVANMTLFVEDLKNLPAEMKDDTYIDDQDFLRGLAEAATVNDPIIGSSGEMPLTRVDSTRMCMAGECIIGNLFTDAYRWKTDADVAFVPSGGLRGPGWPAGPVRVSDLWHALPFANTLCTGLMSGVTMFKLLNFSTSVATFQSTYTDMGDRLVQVSGLRYVYNTQLNHSRLISVDVWDRAEETYKPLERLKFYSFVTDNFLCDVFDPFPSFFGSTEIEGEVPGSVGEDLSQDVVEEYLGQLGRPYDTSKQGRLRNYTSATSYLNLVHTQGSCPQNTYWNEPIKTCSPCLAGPDGKHLSLSDEIIELETERGTAAISRIVLSNREVFDLNVHLKNRPSWVAGVGNDANASRSSATSELLEEGGEVLLVAGESVAFEFAARTDLLEAGTAQGTVTFGFVDATQKHPGCDPVRGDVSFDVIVRVAPPPNMNYLSGGIRGAGLALMGVIVLSSLGFSAWVFRYRRIRVVQASQPFFLQLVCLGTLVMGTGIIPMSIDDSIASEQGCDIACMSVPWLLSTGFTISFSALFSKIWRLNQLIYSSTHFQKVRLTEKDVLTPFGILFFLNFAFLLAWTLVDPLHWDRVPVDGEDLSNSYGTCRVGKKGSIAFLVLILVTNGGALFLACLQAYRARHFSVEYSESKYIGMAMFGWLQVLIVGVPVMFLVAENPNASFFLESALLFVLCMSTLLLMFVPKLIVFKKQNRRGGTDRRREGVHLSKQMIHVVETALGGATSSTTGATFNRKDSGLAVSRPRDEQIELLKAELSGKEETIRILEEQLRGNTLSNQSVSQNDAVAELRADFQKSQDRIRLLEEKMKGEVPTVTAV